MTTKSHNLNAAASIMLAAVLAANYGWWGAIPLALAIYWRGE